MLGKQFIEFWILCLFSSKSDIAYCTSVSVWSLLNTHSYSHCLDQRLCRYEIPTQGIFLFKFEKAKQILVVQFTALHKHTNRYCNIYLRKTSLLHVTQLVPPIFLHAWLSCLVITMLWWQVLKQNLEELNAKAPLIYIYFYYQNSENTTYRQKSTN